MNKNKLYKAAVRSKGSDNQEDMVIEECLELCLEIRHYNRAKSTRKAVISEIADVTIMCQQLARIFGLREVKAEIEAKRERLANSLLKEGRITREEYDEIMTEEFPSINQLP